MIDYVLKCTPSVDFPVEKKRVRESESERVTDRKKEMRKERGERKENSSNIQKEMMKHKSYSELRFYQKAFKAKNFCIPVFGNVNIEFVKRFIERILF